MSAVANGSTVTIDSDLVSASEADILHAYDPDIVSDALIEVLTGSDSHESELDEVESELDESAQEDSAEESETYDSGEQESVDVVHDPGKVISFNN
jgi:hypothetical protein